mgnify:CR=1 FL=1
MIKIIFLGTSDAIPSAARNHSSIWVNFGGENLLVDCGEGTQRQIRKAKLNPCRITRILITHWHTDHILGLPGLLKTLGMSGYNKTLYLYGPRGTVGLMNALLKLFAFEEEYPIKIQEVDGRFLETKDFYLEAEKMIHGINCNAYSFVKKSQRRIDKKKLQKSGLPPGPVLQKFKEGKDIVYNGKKYLAKSLTYFEKGKKISFVFDTKANDKIIPLVKDSDVLISEASSIDKEGADRYKHMMAEQAAQIAKKARVKRLILSHISQRVEKNLKGNLTKAKKIFKNTSIAKDLDVIEV